VSITVSIKQRLRYKDVTWLMSSVDVESVLERLGMEVVRAKGDEVWSFCPDHKQFTGREPSHPKWSVNTETGETFCFTEGRGSNLVWTVSRLRDVTPDEAVRWMTGSESVAEMNELRLQGIRRKLKRYLDAPDASGPSREMTKLWVGEEDIEKGIMLESGYRFFVHPPGKKRATNIGRETVDAFRVIQRTWGYYANRVIIPFYEPGKMVGYAAIDILGCEAWLRNHPGKCKEEYRKVLHPPNFESNGFLFGLSEMPEGLGEAFVTEGPREVMKLRQEGYWGTAVLKAHISSTQIRLLGTKTPRILYVMFDGDAAGYDANRKVADKLKDVFQVRIINVPLGMDPKNLCANDIENLKKKARPVLT